MCVRRVALAVGLIVLASPGTGRADYLVDSELRSAIKGKTLKAKTAKDGDAWQVRIAASGGAEFKFANGGRSLARWQVVGKRIEFVFDQSNEKTCRAIFVLGDKRQEWRECDSERLSSYIIEPIFAAAQPSSAQPRSSSDVERKLRVERDALQSRRYEEMRPLVTEVIERGSALRRAFDFQAGSTYAVVAACDENCSHVQLTLHTPAGKILAQSPEQHHTVIISGPADETGAYKASVTATDCKKEKCTVGLQVLRLKARSD